MNRHKTNHKNKAAIIAVDAMGGDAGVHMTIEGCARVLKDHPDTHFLLFGDQTKITPLLNRFAALTKTSEIVHTDGYIKSGDKPSAALRNSKGTSMRMAIEAVKAGKAHAVISAGNTGALMALAKMVLRPLENVHRPAIASIFPTEKTPTVVLDLGANVLVEATNLVQFAILGTAFARSFLDKQMPRVGLLNVGSEAIKGPDHVRGAADILSRVDLPADYIGFIEGTDLTNGTVDVAVCDGYAGNVALKTAEGVGTLTRHLLKESLAADPISKIGALLARMGFNRFAQRVDPRRYNGGVFLGLNGLCVKSHGGADALAFSSALNLAVTLAEKSYVESVASDITHLMSQEALMC
jgi:glycerol-3-phosphate acyltransferase PlsX